MTKEEAKQKIAELVAKYDSLTPVKLKDYNEQSTKNGFIEPLFRALGWDTENTDEVSPEYNASKGRVDYAFKLHDVSQFFVEAKPLKADINNPEYIKQAVTYAYNKGVTWAVLTNFESLRIFNAQKQSQSIPIDYKQYIPDFDRLWLLSKESLEIGLLTKEAQKWGILPPPLPVETRLFTQLRQWREELFNQLYAHNKKSLNFTQIDEVIQKLFNRLIFIRNCEDRDIEEKKILSALHQWKSNNRKINGLLEALHHIFTYYNSNYDSDLFEKHLLDNENIIIEEDTIEDILNGLYDIPGSMASYDFSVIDADVLGTVYEQYLGYVAIKAKEKAKTQLKLGIIDDEVFTVTDKISHRKEQGIYYTPSFITDYIVKKTVGRFIKEHSPQEPLTIRKMKILDPACGSGSFLIRAYNELLIYHAYQRGKSVSDLTKEERTTILLDNIFGVDLDKQAVEVARLNLLIRSLSGQYHLPPLKNNIKRGNSLISGTEEELKKYFGEEWNNKSRFNWEEEYPDIMKKGGFDVIIGNPPWVSLTGKHKSVDFSEAEMKYLFENSGINTYSPNLYEAFIWRGLNLLNNDGLFSFIVPDRLASNQQFIKLREYILTNFTIVNLMFRFPFPGVIADTMVFVIKKRKSQKNHIIEILDYPTHKISKIPQNKFLSSADFQLFYVDSHFTEIFDKISSRKNVKRLDGIVKITSGCGAKSELLHDKRLNKAEIKVLKGENITRYARKGHFWFEFTPDNLSGRTRDEDKLGMKEKVLLRKTGGDIIATFDNSGIYPEQSLYFLFNAEKDTLVYLLSVLNSRLINTYYQNFAVTNRNTTPQLKNVDLDQFPIIYPAPAKLSTMLIDLANNMLELNKQLLNISDYEIDKKQQIEKEIKATDDKINKMVYYLYELTPEEIAVVEGKK